MADYQKRGLIVKKLWEDMAEYVFTNVLKGMPKDNRFTLGADIRRLIFDTDIKLQYLELHYGNRGALLNDIDVAAKTLMSVIRLGIKVRAIPGRRSEPMAEKLEEIGSYIGGLKKSYYAKARD